MRQRYIDYADYNIWANNKLIDDLSRVGEELLVKEVTGSFPSIIKTLQHIWLAEVGWLNRLLYQKWEASKVQSFEGSPRDLMEAWKLTSLALRESMDTLDLEQTHTLSSKGNEYQVPAREIAQTVFNHGTYHRGQVVLLLRQLGVETITQTDYIAWISGKELG